MYFFKNIFYKATHTPIGKNIVANFFKVLIIFINQIMLVPLYILYWGTELYSDWIILYAITSFFTLSDIGLNNVTTNRFCMEYVQNNIQTCKSLLVNNFILIIFIGSVFTISTFLYGYNNNLTKSLGLHCISNQTANFVLTTLVLQIFLTMASSIMDAVYYANSKSAKATYLNNINKLSNSLIILIGIILHLSLPYITIIGLFPSIIILIYKHYNTKELFPYYLSFKDRNFILLKEIIKPSIAYMSFPIGNIIIFQGFTLLVNSYFGPVNLILFNTTRTMVNFIRTMIQTITSAIKPEFTLAFGRKDYNFMRQIHRKTLFSCLTLSIIISLFFLMAGPLIYKIWTSNKIEFHYILMLNLAFAMILNSIWEASGATLMSTNNHIGLGRVYILSSLLSISVGVISSKYLVSLNFTALSLCICDLFMSMYAVRKALSLTKDKLLIRKWNHTPKSVL